jgi:hypothetical protein
MNTLKNGLILGVRLFGSLAFLLFQIGRVGIVLFLPAIVLSTATGINIYTNILVMGNTGRGPWFSRAYRIKFCRIVADQIESIDERDLVVKNSSPIFHPSENLLAFLASF